MFERGVFEESGKKSLHPAFCGGASLHLSTLHMNTVCRSFGSKKAIVRRTCETPVAQMELFLFKLRSTLLCALVLFCVQALVWLSARCRWTQKFEEASTMCSTGFGAGRQTTAPVPTSSGKMF